MCLQKDIKLILTKTIFSTIFIETKSLNIFNNFDDFSWCLVLRIQVQVDPAHSPRVHLAAGHGIFQQNILVFLRDLFLNYKRDLFLNYKRLLEDVIFTQYRGKQIKMILDDLEEKMKKIFYNLEEKMKMIYVDLEEKKWKLDIKNQQKNWFSLT